MNRLQRWLVILGSIASLAVSGLASWWAFLDRTVPIAVTAQTIVEPKLIRQGGWFILHREYCATRSGTYLLERALRGGIKLGAIIYQLPDFRLDGSPGCHAQDVQINLPAYLPAGDYTLEVSVIFFRNPIQWGVQIPLPSLPFKVWPR